MIKLIRLIGFSSTLGAVLAAAKNVLAQTATEAAGKGGTNGALPDAGSTGLTYLLFLGGLILFVVGTLKLVLSYRPD